MDALFYPWEQVPIPLTHALDEVLGVAALEQAALEDGLDGVSRVLEENHDLGGHVARDGDRLDGAGGTLGARVLVGAVAAEDVAAAGEEEAPWGGPGLEVLGLDQALHAVEPIHS